MLHAAHPPLIPRHDPPRGHGAPRERLGNAAGFTLIELLIVIVIIGVMIGAALISFGGRDSDEQLERERDRLAALITYVQERAALQTIEYGLRCEQGGYRFVMYDSRKSLWQEDPLDEQLRSRKLPAGLGLALAIEDRQIVLPKPTDPDKINATTDLTPQVIIYSSGDLTRFTLTLLRAAAKRIATVSGTAAGKVDVGTIAEQRR
ncbi:MAG: type II secretion system minor pseudopilin GspH [Steroidobacteraceae bacterium]